MTNRYSLRRRHWAAKICVLIGSLSSHELMGAAEPIKARGRLGIKAVKDDTVVVIPRGGSVLQQLIGGGGR